MTFIDEQSKHLANTSTSKLLRQFATSTMLSNSSNAIYCLCDAIFISLGIAPLALGGLASTFPLITFCTAFSLLISVGGNIQAAVMLRKNDMEAVRQFASCVLTLGLISGFLLTIIFHSCLTTILTLCGASEHTLPYAHDYAVITTAGLCITFMCQGAMGLLRGLGLPNVPLRGQVHAMSLNIILDILFIFVFDFGMKGIAYATILCQAMALGYYYHRLNKAIPGKITIFGCLSKERVTRILSSGLSPFLSNLVGTAVTLLINTTLVEEGGLLGDMYLSTYCIIQRVTQVPVSLAVGFGRGMQTLVAFNFSSSLFIRVRELLMKSIYTVTIVMTVCYLAVAIFPGIIADIFSLDDKMADMMAIALRIGLCIFPFVGSQMISVCFFPAIRRPKVSMFISLFRQICILLPLLLFLPGIFGVNGVWWSMSLADFISVITAWVLMWIETKKLTID